jgi:hypothetical protein
MMLIGFVLTWFIEEIPLRDTVGPREPSDVEPTMA